MRWGAVSRSARVGCEGLLHDLPPNVSDSRRFLTSVRRRDVCRANELERVIERFDLKIAKIVPLIFLDNEKKQDQNDSTKRPTDEGARPAKPCT